MFEKILEAKKTLEGKANKTPVLTSRTLNEITDSKIFLKCENFQRGGAFKFRGAYNAISKLSASEKANGVIAYSSGNHAQAVALVGKLLNVKVTVVMPENAPRIKLAAAEDYGAIVVLYNPESESREVIAEALKEKLNAHIIPPFDNENIIAGQGTAALEFFEETGELDYLLVPCGGGGLLSGSAISAKHFSPSCKVIGVEPETADDAAKSFFTRQLHSVKNPRTIADGTRTPSLGKFTFPLILEHVNDFKTVSESEIIDAVKFLFLRMKIVVEPSGALGVAALLSGKLKTKGKVGVIISGGNIDPDLLSSLFKKV
jgi:threo-3-hydroxy-L-aspartate ammonia-lyase